MIILDTCALIFDALNPEKLSTIAKKAITHAEKNRQLFCCDISLWEIAMLIHKKRLQPGVDCASFLQLVLEARSIEVLSITADIAALSTDHPEWKHCDPADRLIGSTALHYSAKLITCDKQLTNVPSLSIVW